MYRRLTVLLLCCVGLLVACGGGGNGSSDPASSDELETLEPNTLQVGTFGPIKPFVYAVGGEWRGFDVEMVETISRRLELGRVEWTNQDFDTMFTAVASGRYDMNASATSGWAPPGAVVQDSIDQRLKLVDFSRPYFLQRVVYVSRKDDPIESTEDLTRGDRVGVWRGTVQADWATRKLAPKGIEVITYRDDPTAYTALEADQNDAVIESEALVVTTLEDRPKLQAGKESIPDLEAGYCFTFPKESDALRKAFNEELTRMIDSGEYARIYKKWFPDLEVSDLPDESNT